MLTTNNMRDRYILIGILCIAAFLRLWHIESVPPSISWDEAAFGYNAWSVLKTGKDEYGKTYPLLFESFGEYKLPGMVYTVALSEALFGLNEFGIRFPSALFGTLTVLVLYLLTKEYIKKQSAAPLLVAGIAAINPWMISFSRQVFESNASMFFVVTGIYFLFRYTRVKSSIIFAAICFAISIYFYLAARVISPILILTCVIVYRKELITHWKETIAAIVVGVCVIAPLIPVMLSHEGFSRFNQVALTSDPRYYERVERYVSYHRDFPVPQLARVLFSPKKALVDEFLVNYLRNISPVFLFYNGAGLHGLLYYWEIIPIIAGIFYTVRSKSSHKWLILMWLIAYPIASSMTKDQPNALRSLVGAPVFSILSGTGLYYLFNQVSKKSYSNLFRWAVSGITVVSLWYFFYIYFYRQPEVRAHDFGDGHKQMVSYIVKRSSEFETIWVTGDYWRPYIHYLFHAKIDPVFYQASGSMDRIGNVVFARAEWDFGGARLGTDTLHELALGTTLFILSDREYRMRVERGETFRQATPIDGLYSKHEFRAVEL